MGGLDGSSVGAMEGEEEGRAEPEIVGFALIDGLELCNGVGFILTLGIALGLATGFTGVGCAETDGWELGELLGCTLIVGATLGDAVGSPVGA